MWVGKEFCHVHADFLVDLHLDPEDESDIFSRNVLMYLYWVHF
jgi:hypothetical protein